MFGDEMLDRAGVAKYLGVSVGTLAVYRASTYRGTFPPPDGMIGGSPWWHRRTIEAWNKTRPGRTGRPKTVNP